MANFANTADLFNESKATSRTTASEFINGFAGQGVLSTARNGHFRYPQNLGLPPIDKWILFEARAGRHVLRNTIVNELGQTDRTLASVGLYLSETALASHTETEWNKTDLGFLAEFAAQSGKNFSDLLINPSEATLEKFGTALGGSLGAAVSALAGVGAKVEKGDFTGAADALVKSIGVSVGDAMKLIGQAAVSDLAAGLETTFKQPKGTIDSLTGVRPNPRSDMLFTSQLYREHQLTFTLIPRNETEALAVDNIIHFFQFYMLPRYGKNQTVFGADVGNFLIGFPYEFEISMFDGQANELLHVNRIGRSVLLDCKVNHAAGGKTAFVKQGNEFYPVATKLELNFREVKLLARDSSEINRANGVDQSSLSESKEL